MHCHLILSLNAEEDLFMVGKYHKYNGEIMECFFFFLNVCSSLTKI